MANIIVFAVYLAGICMYQSGCFVAGSYKDSFIVTKIQNNYPFVSTPSQIFIAQGSPYDFRKDPSIVRNSSLIWTGNGHLQFRSCDVDYSRNILYLYEFSSASIMMIRNFDWREKFSNVSIDLLHVGVSRSDVKIAVDWVSHNVYWTDVLARRVVMQPEPPDNEEFDFTQYKVIVEDNIERPTGLAVTPVHGFLFWCDVGQTVKIERSLLSGRNRTLLISTGLATPSSIDVDLESKRIYWLDSTRDTVESADFNGNNRTTVLRQSHSTFFDLAVFRDSISVVDIHDGKLKLFNKTSGQMFAPAISMTDGPFLAVTMYSSETQPAQENLCAMGVCSDICVSNTTDAECLCREGFQLDTDGYTCREKEGDFHRALILTNATDVCLLDIKTLASISYASDTLCIVPGDDGINLVDIDTMERQIIFTSRSNILKFSVDRPTEPIKLLSAVSNITGLSLDWTDQNIFWSMGTYNGSINVLSQNTLSYYPLIDTDLHYPRDLLVQPLQRKMAWISETAGKFMIEEANMDGTDRHTLIGSRNFTRPSSLTLDFYNHALYWVDGDDIKRWNLTGSELETIKNEYITSPMLLLVYKNYLAVIDNTYPDSTIRTQDKSSPGNIRQTYTATDMGSLTNIKVLDITNQPKQKGPCENFNGNCEHICIPVGHTKICECEYGFELDVNKETCSSDPMLDNFLLVTDWTHNKIYQVSLDTDDVRALDININGQPNGIAYNHVTKQVIWGDTTSQYIRIVSLNGTGNRIFSDTGAYGSYADRLAIDFTSGNIFYTLLPKNGSVGFAGIAVIAPNGDHKKLIYTQNSFPRDIVIDAEEGLLFWSDFNGVRPFVKKANMDGSVIMDVLTNIIRWPNGLAIDHKDKILYVSDGYYDTIQRCKYMNVRLCTVIYHESGAHIMDVGLLGDYLYYTAWNRQHITRLHKHNQTDVTQIARNSEFGRLDAIALYRQSAELQPTSSVCRARNGLGDCSTFCLPTMNSYTCACEDAVNLTTDGKTCENVESSTTSTSTILPKTPATTLNTHTPTKTNLSTTSSPPSPSPAVTTQKLPTTPTTAKPSTAVSPTIVTAKLTKRPTTSPTHLPPVSTKLPTTSAKYSTPVVTKPTKTSITSPKPLSPVITKPTKPSKTSPTHSTHAATKPTKPFKTSPTKTTKRATTATPLPLSNKTPTITTSPVTYTTSTPTIPYIANDLGSHQGKEHSNVIVPVAVSASAGGLFFIGLIVILAIVIFKRSRKIRRGPVYERNDFRNPFYDGVADIPTVFGNPLPNENPDSSYAVIGDLVRLADHTDDNGDFGETKNYDEDDDCCKMDSDDGKKETKENQMNTKYENVYVELPPRPVFDKSKNGQNKHLGLEQPTYSERGQPQTNAMTAESDV